jgi:hypothetical protein
MLRALVGRLRGWFSRRPGAPSEADADTPAADGDTPESAATQSGRRTVGY